MSGETKTVRVGSASAENAKGREETISRQHEAAEPRSLIRAELGKGCNSSDTARGVPTPPTLKLSSARSRQVEASSWRRHEGAVAGVDYPVRPPDGWPVARSGFGPEKADASCSIISEEDRRGIWRSFERRPISGAEAKALREVRISRGLKGGPLGSGTVGGGRGRSPAGMIEEMAGLSSDLSSSASRGTTEKEPSLLSSTADDTSGESAAPPDPSPPPLGSRPSSKNKHPEDRRQDTIPAVGTAASSTGQEVLSSSVPPGAGGPQHRRSRSGPGRLPSSTASPSKQHRHRPEEQGLERPADAAPQEGRAAPGGQHPGRYHDGDDESRTTSSQGTTTPPRAPELRVDHRTESRRGDRVVTGVRSGGGLSGSSTTGATAPGGSALGHVAGLGLGLTRESVFRLDGEADADDVLRAMMRLIDVSPDADNSDEAQADLRRHDRDHDRDHDHQPGRRGGGGTMRHGQRSAASSVRSNGRTRTSSSADVGSGGGGGGVLRGNTPGIKSGRQRGRPSTSAVAGESALDVEGRTLQSEAYRGEICAGQGPSRRGKRHPAAAAPSSRGPVRAGGQEELSGRKSAPQLGRRRIGGRARAQREFILAESQSAPSGVSWQQQQQQQQHQHHHQQGQQVSLSSLISIGSGEGGVGGAGAGGGLAGASFGQTLTSSGLARDSSLAVSSCSSPGGGASQQQQPRLFSSTYSSTGSGGGELDFPSGSRHGPNDEGRRGGASPPEANINSSGGTRRRPSRQQEQHGGRSTPVAAAGAQRQRRESSRRGGGGSNPSSGSATKTGTKRKQEARMPLTHDRSSKRSGGRATTAGSVGQESSLTSGGGGGSIGDGDDGDDKTTGEQMSAIIAGVTRDAAASVVSLAGISTTHTPLGAEGGGASTVGTQESHRSPPPPAEQQQPTTSSPVKARTSTGGGGSNVTDSSGDNARKGGRKAAKGLAKNDRGDGGGKGGGAGSTAAAGSSPKLSDGASRLTLDGTTPSEAARSIGTSEGAGGSAADRDKDTGGAGVGDTSRSGVLALDERLPRESERVEAAAGLRPGAAAASVSSASRTGRKPGGQDGQAPKKTSKPRVDAKQRLRKGNAASRSSNASSNSSSSSSSSTHATRSTSGKATGSNGGGGGGGGDSPNSLGSGASGRTSNTSGSNTRVSRSMKPSSRARAGGAKSRTDASPPKADAPLPLLAKIEPAVAVAGGIGGARQGEHPRGSVADDYQGGSVGADGELERAGEAAGRLPRISGSASPAASGIGRNKKGAASPHEIKVHSRPVRVESKDLQATTEALTTHHLTVEELLKVRCDQSIHPSVGPETVRNSIFLFSLL